MNQLPGGVGLCGIQVKNLSSFALLVTVYLFSSSCERHLQLVSLIPRRAVPLPDKLYCQHPCCYHYMCQMM